MDAPETPETPQKDRGGRQPKMIAIMIQLPVADHATVMNLTLKKMKQLGEDVPRDRVISEAIQFFAKSFSAQE